MRDNQTPIPDLVGEILTPREAAALLRIGRTKLWELTRTGEFPAYRIGNGRTSSLRYKRSELLSWLEQRQLRPTVAPRKQKLAT